MQQVRQEFLHSTAAIVVCLIQVSCSSVEIPDPPDMKFGRERLRRRSTVQQLFRI